MLGKLFKYEFKNTYKLMFIIYGVMAFVTILGCIAMYGDSDPAGIFIRQCILIRDT